MVKIYVFEYDLVTDIFPQSKNGGVQLIFSLDFYFDEK